MVNASSEQQPDEMHSQPPTRGGAEGGRNTRFTQRSNYTGSGAKKTHASGVRSLGTGPKTPTEDPEPGGPGLFRWGGSGACR